MDEDDSRRRSGGFRPLLEALQRTRREVGVAVGHAVEGVQQWISERWLPVRLVFFGGFSWTISKAFEWFVSLSIEFGSWLASSLAEVSASSGSSQKALLLFLGIYVVHSLGQTKLIWDVRTNLSNMTTGGDSEVRADGGTPEKLWLPGGAIGGIIIGATIGSSFGMDGIFVGAGIGWVLGDEFDTWFDEKFLGPVHTSRDGDQRVEEQ